jgi:hypothetical protein
MYKLYAKWNFILVQLQALHAAVECAGEQTCRAAIDASTVP